MTQLSLDEVYKERISDILESACQKGESLGSFCLELSEKLNKFRFWALLFLSLMLFSFALNFIILDYFGFDELYDVRFNIIPFTFFVASIFLFFRAREDLDELDTLSVNDLNSCELKIDALYKVPDIRDSVRHLVKDIEKNDARMYHLKALSYAYFLLTEFRQQHGFSSESKRIKNSIVRKYS